MMIAFKGRNSMKQYIQNKPIKRGFKVWALCSFNGYVFRLEIYTGANDGNEEGNLGTRVVLKLIQNLEHRGHIVFCDRFFTSIQIAKNLLDLGTFMIGTVKRGSKFFPSLGPVKSRGDYVWKMLSNGLLAGLWKDNKEVPFVSTAAPPILTPMPTCNRRINHHIVEIPIPPAIKMYNQAKSGVDVADQRRSYCQIRYKQLRRWWISIFLFLLDTMIENARFLFNFGKPKKETSSSKDFRLALVDYLAPSKGESYFDAISGHFPGRTESKNRRCESCKAKGIESRTRYECQGCKIALCLDCFGQYHEKLKKE